MKRRAYLATTSGLLTTIAGCTSNPGGSDSDATPTTTRQTTTTTQSTTTQAPTDTTTHEETTESETTTEQTTEETTHPAVVAIEDARASLTDVVDMINEYAGLNQDLTDITAADTEFPNPELHEAIDTARDPIQRGLEHASDQSHQATLHSLRGVAGWLDSYVYYQTYLMFAHDALTDIQGEFYTSNPDYEDGIEHCESNLDNVEDNASGVMDVNTDIFGALEELSAGTVSTKQTQLREEASQLRELADSLPVLEDGLSTFAEGWNYYQDDRASSGAFEGARDACQNATDGFPDSWRPSVQSIGSKAACVGNAVATGADTMVEAALAKQDGNMDTADYRVETAREEIKDCGATSDVEQLDAFLNP